MKSIRFPEEVVRVELFDPPKVCVCCGAASTTVIRTNARPNQPIVLPVCARCAEHEEFARTKGATGCIAVTVALLFLPAALPNPLGGIVGIGLIAAGIWMYVRNAQGKASLLGPNCSATSTEGPVRIVPYENQPIVIEFRNDHVASLWETKLVAMTLARTMFD